MRKSIFEKYQNQFGKFDVDACCDLAGHNRQVDRYWHDCLAEQWRGLHVWCNPPYTSSHLTIEAVLRKYVEEWRADPDHTSAVFVLPDLQSRLPAWRKLFRIAGMRIVEVIPTHDNQGEPVQLFESPDGKMFDLPWPVLVVYAPLLGLSLPVSDILAHHHQSFVLAVRPNFEMLDLCNRTRSS